MNPIGLFALSLDEAANRELREGLMNAFGCAERAA
jgi:hypothetical protein